MIIQFFSGFVIWLLLTDIINSVISWELDELANFADSIGDCSLGSL